MRVRGAEAHSIAARPLPHRSFVGDWRKVHNCEFCKSRSVKCAAQNDSRIKRVIGDSPLITAVIENTSSPFNIFPNPTTGLLNIQNIPDNADARVIDMSGRTILFQQSSLAGLNTIDVSSFNFSRAKV